jgi:hypothetical protein
VGSLALRQIVDGMDGKAGKAAAWDGDFAFLEERTFNMADDSVSEGRFTAADRNALIGLVVEVRLRFDSLDKRFEAIDRRLGKVEEERALRSDLQRLELRLAEKAEVILVARIEHESDERAQKLEQTQLDVQSMKTRLAYMAGATAAAVALVQVAIKLFWH